MANFWKPGNDRPDARPSVAFRGDEEFPVGLFEESGQFSFEKRRQRHPIFKHRHELLYLVKKHGVTVVVGETGCGKTTQLPQYLMEAGWAEGGRLIACTQPRRIAAQTVALRVSEEMRVSLGAEVGYSIRFEEVTTPGVTKIKFLTDGVLIREMMADPLLSRYSVIMVDEAHERSVTTDVLLGLLKKIQKRRPELRVIIASATMDAASVATFFDTSAERIKVSSVTESLPDRKPASITVEGRSHSVRVHYSMDPVSSYVLASVSTTLSIHKMEPAGDILIFLTGQDDVDAVVNLLNTEAENFPRNSPGLLVLPLFAGLSRADQELVFRPAAQGRRKVIVSTNIAETSVTIPGIVYVIDSGFAKQRFYNPLTDVDALVTAPISRASAEQRAGRAGRMRPGKCFRLYTEDTYCNDMKPETVPEIQRSNLVSTVLQLKALGIDNIMRFDWLAPPSSEAMIRALELLYAIGVLDTDAKLTTLGHQVAEFPLDPMMAKMVLSSSSNSCSSEAVTIAAMLSVQSIWVSSKGRQRELDDARDQFAVVEGDHVTYLNVYESFLRAKQSPQWCHENLINYQAMKTVVDVRKQLSKLLQQLGITLKSSDGDIKCILKTVTAGFFAHAAELEPSGDSYKLVRGGQQMYIHPSSVLFRTTPKWVVFHSVMVTERFYMRDVAISDPEWLTEVAPHYFERRRRSQLPS
ncbi:ATP-dependent RNA helicase DDX35 [Marchantia polymorpha subsp. ruderalis]|uniref:RNA helicase n=3 Tax=Marchantia polymorpha TaxID=3197 RepID=A0AAF6B5M3_MARPO|nr:hypothetical protein MARPO_0080s0021 [Marchantia polymorpha]BBN07307.1 hypothetical protein Mp_4g02780 [Marchantia polymorpha subsp. ruderalis]|eukprot:PTQ34397.1 hypothetical protein MARPO_0080s0021 [Marchantia polymorpha]